MSVDRSQVRALVRAELEKRLRPTASRTDVSTPALVEIYIGTECDEDLDFPTRPPCVIEPDRPCINSGYCKKLGY